MMIGEMIWKTVALLNLSVEESKKNDSEPTWLPEVSIALRKSGRKAFLLKCLAGVGRLLFALS